MRKATGAVLALLVASVAIVAATRTGWALLAVVPTVVPFYRFVTWDTEAPWAAKLEANVLASVLEVSPDARGDDLTFWCAGDGFVEAVAQAHGLTLEAADTAAKLIELAPLERLASVFEMASLLEQEPDSA